MLQLIGYRKLAMTDHYVKSTNCQKIQKGTKSSNTPVFTLSVVWSDGHKEKIIRLYTEIFDFMKVMQQSYPTVLIPELKGAKWFEAFWKARKEEKKKAMDEFFQVILGLPENIARGKEVCAFFEYVRPEPSSCMSDPGRNSAKELEPRPVSSASFNHQESEYESIDNVREPYSTLSIKPKSISVFDCKTSDNSNSAYWAVQGYTKRKSGEVDLTEGAAVSVLQRELSGWWFVHVEDTDEQGWAPASCLLPTDRSNLDDCKVSGPVGEFVASKDFEALEPDEVSCNKGDRIEVIEASLDGWWMVRCKDKVGRIPATNLEPVSNQVNQATNRSSLYHQIGIYKKYSPPPRRNSKVTVEELYAKVDRCHRDVLQKKKPDEIVEYAEVDRDRNFKSSSYKEKEEEDDDDDDDDDHTSDHCYINASEMNSRHPYINVVVKPPQEAAVMVKYYRVKEKYSPHVKHQRQPFLIVEVGDVIESHLEQPDKIHGKLYKLADGSHPSPREGWIPRNFLELHEPGVDIATPEETPAVHSRISVPVSKPKPSVAPQKPALDAKPKSVLGINDDLPSKQNMPRSPATPQRSETTVLSNNGLKPKPAAAVVDAHSSVTKVSPAPDKTSSPQTFTIRKIGRTECESMLLNSGVPRQFIIRESTKVGHYALSVNVSNRIRHFPIELTPEKKYFIGKYNFGSLQEVINYYKENPLFELEDGSGITLDSSL